LYRYYTYSKNQKYLDFIVKWFEDRFKEGLPEKNINTMAPMLTLTYLYEDTHNPLYLDRCTKWAEWVLYDLPRTEYGIFQHVVSGGDNVQQVWDDTLFMTVLFIARYGMLTGRKEFIEEAEYQFLMHIDFLKDRSTGLWFHGWSFIRNDNFANALWARGNSWITAGIPLFLEITGTKGSTERFLKSVLLQQAEALKKYQRESGLWNTLLNDPDSYEEASATAGFSYGLFMAVRGNYLPVEYLDIAKKAARGVLGCIDEQGSVNQVSYGTGMGNDLDHYKNIPICPMAYGQSLTLLMLTELVQCSN
jgi:unsaturated rhamnogalacturonyl hydrolase